MRRDNKVQKDEMTNHSSGISHKIEQTDGCSTKVNRKTREHNTFNKIINEYIFIPFEHSWRQNQSKPNRQSQIQIDRTASTAQTQTIRTTQNGSSNGCRKASTKGNRMR
ncbi:hypothetical protein Drorol1_Dr00007599 [Drosera rotundifolia]